MLLSCSLCCCMCIYLILSSLVAIYRATLSVRRLTIHLFILVSKESKQHVVATAKTATVEEWKHWIKEKKKTLTIIQCKQMLMSMTLIASPFMAITLVSTGLRSACPVLLLTKQLYSWLWFTKVPFVLRNRLFCKWPVREVVLFTSCCLFCCCLYRIDAECLLTS